MKPVIRILSAVFAAVATAAAADFNVRDHGAKGDGTALDSPAIQKAIDAAADAGGGTVVFPAGTYLSYSLRLKSNVGLHLGHGAVLKAATPGKHGGAYDLPEPNEWDAYQDFGHSHWKNSLIWGIGLENVSITGPGLIDGGEGLTRRGPGPRRKENAGDTPLTLKDAADASAAVDPEGKGSGEGVDEFEAMNGEGNKAISLKLCRNVTLRDFSVSMGGHFALLATGVDRLFIDNVTVDSNRDGFDIDCCRHVRISNCVVNTANDDAIVLKSSFGLGEARATENVVITGCHVSGFDPGTVLDGTYGRTQEVAPDRDRVTGRIKFGTESNGGFRNITIANCTFERCRGIALETVDGGILEDVTISNVTMREVTSAPIFLRVGARLRGPDGAKPGAIRRIRIDNLTVFNAHHEYSSIIAGIPDGPIEDVSLSNIRIHSAGGGTAEDAKRILPENEKAYPEPSMFGVTPSHGFFIRHANNLRMDNVEMHLLSDDKRPAVIVEDSSDVSLHRVQAKVAEGVPPLVTRNVDGLHVSEFPGAADN
ncbi:MAG: right-handed parallel beta-helix repeat-containing protein [Akkermansiaceae bacterium]|nr:right-handed parallel beta-helix repeat-containing protein [Akkermansiaceae bacterium]MCP5543955.1 right-handed parallel beta-helix repeat-containing protein [Akkermansiaceae bacterium]MCP5548133.1 right-handed parallel beta-helix repeat-containing protein [Akkermansiaceae bacterium]